MSSHLKTIIKGFQIRKFHSTLFVFLIPAVLVASLAAAINLGILFSFNHDQQDILTQVNQVVAVNTEAASLVVDIGQLNKVVADTLDGAATKKMDEAELYDVHTKIVNDLAALDKRIRHLVKNAYILGVESRQLSALTQDFESYRNIAMVATDIISIDPTMANDYIGKAQRHFLFFAQNTNIVCGLLGERIHSKIEGLQAASRNNFIRMMLISLSGLVALLGLSYVSAARVSQGIRKLIDALRILSDKRLEPPSLSDLADLKASESGDIKAMADAVLSFRATLIEQKKAEADLRVAATAFDSQEGMLITDANNLILRINHAFTTITGFTASDVTGKNPRMFSSDIHDSNFYAAMWKQINTTGAWEGEIWNQRKNGEVYPAHLTITAVTDTNANLTNYVASLVDITEHKAAEKEIHHLAFYDHLTKLPNRRLLLDRLQQALASSVRSQRVGALLFIDLDNFKTLNDTLGHDIGDLLLQQVAQRLTSCVRDADTVARLGGDEFVVMLEGMSENALEAAAQTEIIGEKILAALNLPFQLATQEYRNTASIGATLFSDQQQSIDELFKQADIAMYQAKHAGRNTLRFFDQQMQDAVNARAVLENELHKALDNQQFHLYYQVQVDSSGQPIGAEALIRWIHPEHGLVSPAQFIPLAEETGLIIPIGLWVLDTACAQLKAWESAALTQDLVVAVNVSSQQFRQADFVARVQEIVTHHAINPKLLKLELTESLLLESIEDAIATMNALSDIGIQFSLDDFGTGYSSLQYLKKLPLNQLKIDQSFVRDIMSDNSDKAIVHTIIAITQSLSLDVIAEGVETEDQRQLLLDIGCTQFQGYLFGKPVPIEQFEVLMTQSTRLSHPPHPNAMV